MITYEPLWMTMRQKGITQYKLIHYYHVSPGQITRLKRNESVSTHTIETFCRILDCRVEDVMVYSRSDESPDAQNDFYLIESLPEENQMMKAAEPGVCYQPDVP